ncbi:MAG: TIM barrel protein [Gaiellales bacterium]
MRLCAHLSMLFRELPVLERPAAAAAAGFTVVETWWLPHGQMAPWVDAVTAAGLEVRSLNCDGGDLEAGDRGFLNVPERRAWTVAACEEAVAVARSCGASFVNLLAGRDTGDADPEAQLAVAAETLAACAEIARGAGIALVVEPINLLDVPGYLVPTPDAAVWLLKRSGAHDVRLLFDAYHAARAGLDPVAEAVRHVRRIGHVHYADCPGRGAPGTGDVDLGALVTALVGAGYEGDVGLELDPGGSIIDARELEAAWT